MKQVFAALVMMMVTSSAFANCYQFARGQGPTQVGNVPMNGTASSVCVRVGQSGTYTELVFEGAFDPVFAEIISSANSRSEDKAQYTLGRVAIGNEMFNATGTLVYVETVKNAAGLSEGFLTIQAGRDFPVKFSVRERAQSGWTR